MVDPGVQPAVSQAPDLNGQPRDVARVVGVSGVAMDFVANELLIATSDQAALDAFLGRWGGTVLSSTEPVGAQSAVHLVRLDPSSAQLQAIVDELNGSVPDITGSFTTSSERGAKLLAIALAEANTGRLTVTPNFLALFDDIAGGATAEAPSGDSGFVSDAFSLPYINRGSPQDIGVGAAWQALQRTGRLGNRVRMMILDGGFEPNLDFPSERSAVGSFGSPNLLQCGGGSCPWHGTNVTNAAMGGVDNAFGAVGAAGPVGTLLAVPFQADLFAFISTLERIINATIFGNPKIINMSFGLEIDLGWDIAVKVACLGTCPSPSELMSVFTAPVAASGKLLFASAGNSGKDVDNGADVIEGSTHVPCESAGVICVGGMGHNQAARDPGSNFGSKTGDATVDIYGPYSVWVGPDPASPGNTARLVNGTSFASPFVAGVAALVWAADPTLSSDQVWTIMRETAHVGGVGVTGNDRRINALGAVARVVGGEPPSVVLTGAPTADLNRELFVTAQVTDDGQVCGSVTCPLIWSPTPARTLGNSAYFRFDTVGAKTIAVSVEDPVGQSASASLNTTVVNSAPVVAISTPAPGTSVAVGIDQQLLGTATDLNEGPDPGPGAIACTWTSSSTADTAFPLTGCNTTIAFSSTGMRTLTLSATDSQGVASTSNVSITVTPAPTNYPPDIELGTLGPATNYEGGYTTDVTLTATGVGTDPESNNPISYTWRATSFVPNSSTVFASDVIVEGPSASGALSWSPASTPSLTGGFAEFGNACYNGQVVRLTLSATDSLGNVSTRSLPDIKVYECVLL